MSSAERSAFEADDELSSQSAAVAAVFGLLAPLSGGYRYVGRREVGQRPRWRTFGCNPTLKTLRLTRQAQPSPESIICVFN